MSGISDRVTDITYSVVYNVGSKQRNTCAVKSRLPLGWSVRPSYDMTIPVELQYGIRFNGGGVLIDHACRIVRP